MASLYTPGTGQISKMTICHSKVRPRQGWLIESRAILLSLCRADGGSFDAADAWKDRDPVYLKGT
jgi:hypothetical protein